MIGGDHHCKLSFELVAVVVPLIDVFVVIEKLRADDVGDTKMTSLRYLAELLVSIYWENLINFSFIQKENISYFVSLFVNVLILVKILRFKLVNCPCNERL